MDNLSQTDASSTDKEPVTDNQIIRPVLIIPTISLLLYLSYLAIGIGVSDLYAYSPRQKIEFWQNQQKSPTPEELQKALINIRSAIHWSPKNGEYHDIEGLLLYYQALNQHTQQNTAAFTDLTQHALNSFRIASELRPHWPYSYANIAMMKSALNQYDDEFSDAITQATRFGPWENAVNVTVTVAGFAGWHKLTEQTRRLVIENTERGLNRNTKRIKQQLTAINKLNLACIHIQSGHSRKKLCGY